MVAHADLAELRREIDSLDDRIAELLALRFQKTDAVGRLKAEIGEATINPERQRQRQSWLLEVAQRHGLPSDLLMQLHRAITAEVVVRHRSAGAV